MKQKKRRRHHNVRPFNSLRFCAELWSLVGWKLGETSWTLNSRDGIEFGWHDLDFFGFNPSGSNDLVQYLFFAYPLLEFVSHQILKSDFKCAIIPRSCPLLGKDGNRNVAFDSWHVGDEADSEHLTLVAQLPAQRSPSCVP